MRGRLVGLFACGLGLSLANPAIAQNAAQGTASTQAAQVGAAAAPAQSQPVFRTEELDQMLAPIALYPDQLLAQVLMASTYPLEIVRAERWVSDPGNAKLQGDALAKALDQESWDPSVKSLVPFPPVLKMMNDQIEWTQRLGDAFLAQQADIMEAIQRLRRQAQEAGTLQSNDKQKIVVENVQKQPAVTEPTVVGQAPPAPVSQETIIIQPSNPEVVYVPSYDPAQAYGSWPYPSYPPAYYPYPSYYPLGGAFVGGMAFAAGAAVVGSLWGWGDANWGGDSINISADRYNNINRANIQSGRAERLSSNTSSWRHDPSHRGGVGYRDAASRQNFQRASAPANATRNFRGFDNTQARPGQSNAGQGRLGQGNSGQRQQLSQAGRGAAGAGAGLGQRQGQARSPQARAASAGSAGTNRATTGARQGAGAGGIRQQSAATGAGRQLGAQQRQPGAFQGLGNGGQTRSQAARGAASRQSMGASRNAGATRASSGARAGGARAGGGGRGGRR